MGSGRVRYVDSMVEDDEAQKEIEKEGIIEDVRWVEETV